MLCGDFSLLCTHYKQSTQYWSLTTSAIAPMGSSSTKTFFSKLQKKYMSYLPTENLSWQKKSQCPTWQQDQELFKKFERGWHSHITGSHSLLIIFLLQLSKLLNWIIRSISLFLWQTSKNPYGFFFFKLSA